MLNFGKSSVILSPSIDLLYDYAPFLDQSESEGGIGTFPDGIAPPRVAIVGAGICGLIAATELLRAGVTDITVFESRDRIGGRAWSQPFDPEQPHLIAEMGAMRFPPSATGLFHYLKRFGISTSVVFPDPGVANTELHYRGKSYIWPAGNTPPPLFRNVHKGWRALTAEGCQLGGITLVAPAKISAMLKAQLFNEAHIAWQAWLNAFRDESFYSAIVKIFTSPQPPGGYIWKRPEDFELFGSLGIGSGGFLPVFQTGFTEILRLVINGYEDDQRLITGGISLLVERLASQSLCGKRLYDYICFRSVNRIYKDNGKIKLVTDGETIAAFDRVIVTTNNRAMQMVHGIAADDTFLSQDISRAVRETHLTGSSKLFMLTPDKFWLKHNLPHTIQSDGFVRGVYCLDYEPDNPQGRGVVLLSYTWEDDAHKLLSITNKRLRCRLLIDDLAVINPEFAHHLVPVDGNYERHVLQHDWLTDCHSAGAFKLNYPGEDVYSQRLFFQYKTANNPEQDTGLYLAGCGCSFTGGWAEGAVQTAINSACAVIRSAGGTLLSTNPMDSIHSVYHY
ncbi:MULTISPECIES: NAD(P)/FAD-dependent oxidoreductase [unclassified Enterobacter]|uniref:NAD(P)/FAD-dependent oxidoreductase n=1 Tax=unclassified Enterobacter TaxID=2608935 RepID=UPI0003ED11FE|nr:MULTISPECIES: NAD(P)/FAD-dependent oxidoreductase [unclassified Enterobacter]EWG67548.1 Tryptophan 2-monooxygenase [Enterobacter sp. DC4]EWG69915.1 Tryptophan 2-monooxygenase [Enterobacter sp. DC3]